jgi:hypothetical protein
MLYWAEGRKNRNNLCISNSDPQLILFFRRFVSECFDRPSKDFHLRLNVYLTNGLSLRTIEDHWLDILALPRDCLRAHTINHMPTSSSGRKRSKLPYGTASLRVARSTELVQHVFGAIQEYAGFEAPQWLD